MYDRKITARRFDTIHNILVSKAGMRQFGASGNQRVATLMRQAGTDGLSLQADDLLTQT